MNKIHLYSDETKADSSHDFNITTTICGEARHCILFAGQIGKIVEKHKPILGPKFDSFHARNLNARNWRRVSGPYIEVLDNLFHFLEVGYLRMIIFIESSHKRSSNSVFLEDILKKHLSDKDDIDGRMYKQISRKDLSAIYKNADKIYNYLRNRHRFGDENQLFEYFPDASGKILNYRNRKCSILPPSGLGVPILTDYYEVIALLANGLARVLAKSGWGTLDRQKMILFSPLDDKDSYLIQSADLVSNFMLSLIKYIAGASGPTIIKKAETLLRIKAFQENKAKMAEEFIRREGAVFCVKPDLEACLLLECQKRRFAGQLLPA